MKKAFSIHAFIYQGARLFLMICVLFMTSQNVGATENIIKTPSGLSYKILKPAQGAVAKAGQVVTVHYSGWLSVNGNKGKMFDSSLERGEPFEFLLGAHRVIKGWEEGIAGMKVGEKRVLMIPSFLAYGDQGAGSVIPPNADLIFEVELLGLRVAEAGRTY